MGILDGKNQLMPPGKIGEVCIQGPNVTKGYLNNPSANKEAFAGTSHGRQDAYSSVVPLAEALYCA